MSAWIMVLAFVCALGSWDTDSAVGAAFGYIAALGCAVLAAITAGLVTL